MRRRLRSLARPFGPSARLRPGFRLLVAAAAFVVAWLVAAPSAFAAAPMCDPRGAIVFAPPPQMQDPEQSLDVPAPCDGAAEDPLAAKHVAPGRGPRVSASTEREPVLVARCMVPLAPPLERIDAPHAVAVRVPRGVRLGVERPPRA